jgi:hypothetical protein
VIGFRETALHACRPSGTESDIGIQGINAGASFQRDSTTSSIRHGTISGHPCEEPVKIAGNKHSAYEAGKNLLVAIIIAGL